MQAISKGFNKVDKYYLFIDTEASGLPKKWTLPYSHDENWPHAVQVSWIIYDGTQTEISRQDHFILNDGFDISESALKIHHISADYLQQHGEDRTQVLKYLAADLEKYRPLLVGHFVKFDYYLLSAGYYRSKMENPLDRIAVFCTMQASESLVENTTRHQLVLNDLYQLLFQSDMVTRHNAIADAAATAQCFFKLWNGGQIDLKMIDRQDRGSRQWRDPAKTGQGCFLPSLMIFLVLGLIIYLCYS